MFKNIKVSFFCQGLTMRLLLVGKKSFCWPSTPQNHQQYKNKKNTTCISLIKFYKNYYFSSFNDGEKINIMKFYKLFTIILKIVNIIIIKIVSK